MRNSLLVMLFTCSALLANDYETFQKAYAQNEYESYKVACESGKRIFFNGENDEKLISLIGLACLRADYIDMLGLMQSRLYLSSQGRANASLFASVLLQKRLIIQFMHDTADISTFALPVTDHPLSVVFSAIRDGRYELLSEVPKRIRIKQGEMIYTVYSDSTKKGKLAVDIRFKDGTIEEHRYR